MKIKSRLLLLQIILIISGISACNNGDDTIHDEPIKYEDPIVHIGGSMYVGANNTAVHWENGVKKTQAIPNLNAKNELYYSTDLTVKDGDVYMVGCAYYYSAGLPEVTIGLLWKNGQIEKQYNSPSEKNPYTRIYISFSGDDLYTAFKQYGSNIHYFYKNDEKIGFVSGFVSAISADKNDLYLSGSTNDLNGGAAVWKNGAVLQLGNAKPEGYTQANDVFAINNNVYVAGQFNFTSKSLADEAILWENGNKTVLSSVGDANALSVFAINQDVYVGGYSSDIVGGIKHATYWKNGVRIVLDQSKYNSRILDLAVSKSGKVYALGTMSDHDFTILWVDGTVDANFDGTKEMGYYKNIFLEEK